MIAHPQRLMGYIHRRNHCGLSLKQDWKLPSEKALFFLRFSSEQSTKWGWSAGHARRSKTPSARVSRLPSLALEKGEKITPVLQGRLENILWQIRSSCKVTQLELVLKGLEAIPHPVLEPAVPLNDRHCLHPQCGETQQGLFLNKLVR